MKTRFLLVMTALLCLPVVNAQALVFEGTANLGVFDK